MRKRSAKLFIVVLATCACASAAAAMYRWVDENGVTVYSATPPPSGEAIELQQQSAPSADAVDAARERLQRQRERAFDEEEARKGAAAEQEKQEAEAKFRAENCAAARNNLKKLRDLGPRMLRTSDGRLLRLSEEEVQMQIEKTQGQIEDYCD